MVFKASYVGRIANCAFSFAIKEWCDANFKIVALKPVMSQLYGQIIYKNVVRAKVPT